MYKTGKGYYIYIIYIYINQQSNSLLRRHEFVITIRYVLIQAMLPQAFIYNMIYSHSNSIYILRPRRNWQSFVSGFCTTISDNLSCYLCFSFWIVHFIYFTQLSRLLYNEEFSLYVDMSKIEKFWQILMTSDSMRQCFNVIRRASVCLQKWGTYVWFRPVQMDAVLQTAF